jgi:peptidoglycan/LPS O-acetylase OafA/YrhL
MARRWLRTLPLYSLCLALLMAVGPTSPTWHHLPWFLSLTQNLGWRMVDDGFAVSWSLTVEEWFYLLFSGLLFGACALAGRRVAFWGITLVFLIVPAWLRWQLPADVDWAQVTSKAVIYRLDAIAFGVVVAWMQMRRVSLLRHSAWLLASGLLVIALFWGGVLDRVLAPTAHVRKSFMFEVASFGFALWLPAAASLPCRLPRAATAVVTVLSRQSYAIYLVHLSLIEWVDLHFRSWPAPVLIVVTLSALFGLTWLSYRYFEAPILRLRPRQRKEELLF